jgi:hypothetical protein
MATAYLRISSKHKDEISGQKRERNWQPNPFSHISPRDLLPIPFVFQFIQFIYIIHQQGVNIL